MLSSMTITEKSTDIWAHITKALTDPFGMLTNAPQLDLTQGVELFFEVVQRTIDANREFAGIWAGLVGSLTAAVRDHAQTDAEDSMENAVAAADSDGRSKRAGAVIDDLATVDGR
jgi:hypothetical protein